MRKICLRCGAKFGSQAEYCPHDGSLLASDDQLADPLLGRVVLEQFRIEEQIGVGGMGTVYRAHQTTIDRDVAIKVLRAELARDEQAVARFEREARVCTALDHPNLVRVFLSGRFPDGRLYIVMELLEGRSLADEIEQHGPPALERAVIMIMKLCAGLAAVHAAGIVHRDIKPENVYLVRRGRDPDFVKLVDFGVARVLEGDGVGPATTQSGRVFGTATYISPEAATGDDTDHRSDIYSLGVLSYQLLTGELPFEGSTAGAVLMKHVHEAPPLLQTVGRGAEVPDEVAQVIMRALSKEPEARQQTLAEFLDPLAEAAGNAGLLANARAVLLGTIWGDELAAPGTYLAELLGSSRPSSVAPALAATQRPAAGDRDPKDEALLSSAPTPFGTTSFDLARAPRRKKRGHGWLWAGLGLLAVVLVGFVAGTWLKQEASTAKEPVPFQAASDELEGDGTIPELRADAVSEPAEEPAAMEATELVAEPEATEEAEAIEEAEPKEAEPKEAEPIGNKEPPSAGLKPKKKVDKPKSPAPASAPARSVSEDQLLEPDDGIDWSPPDFPQSPSLPTGTPEIPARNPVVIDEPPP